VIVGRGERDLKRGEMNEKYDRHEVGYNARGIWERGATWRRCSGTMGQPTGNLYAS
jgi:hypothetical protein